MDDMEKTSKKRMLREIIIYFLVWGMVFGTPLSFALADPVLPDPTTAIGDIANWSQTATSLTINDVANGAVIHWNNFDVGQGGTVQFNQVSNNAYVMNTVNLAGVGDGAATNIAGNLLANGGLFVVNPRGLVIAPTAYINANTFVGAAMKIDDAQFKEFAQNAADGLPNELEFNGALLSQGKVRNEGYIVGQKIALVGKQVQNLGTIRTNTADGLVVLAAGDKVKLGCDGSNVFVDVSTGLLPNSVDNSGSIGAGQITDNGDGTFNVADETGGNVILAAGDIYSTAMSGLASLRAEARRDVQIDGDIDATGQVEILAGQSDGIFGIGAAAELNVNGSITAGDIRLKNGQDVEPGENSYSRIYVSGHLTANAGDVIVEAVHDVILDGDVWASDNVFLNGDEDGWGDPRDEIGYNPIAYGGGDVITQNVTAGEGVEIRGNAIDLNGNVDAGGNILIAGRSSEDAAGDTLGSHDDGGWGDVHAAGTLDAGGNILIMATGQELVWVTDEGGTGPGNGQDNPGGGNENSSGRWNTGNTGEGHGNIASGAQGQGNGVYHNRGMAGVGNQEGHWEYGDYSFGSIYLDGDVTATGELADGTGDIMLMNNTYTAPYVTLKAGRDVVLANGEDAYPPENAEFLTGDTELTIIAGAKEGVDDGKIYAENTTISVTGSKLTLEQDPTLDLADFTFDNQSITNLTLISDVGSVVANDTKPQNAANKWDSIGAQAAGDITLAGDGCAGIQLGDSGVAGLALLAGGNVDISGASVRSDADYPDGSIEAGSNVNIVVSNDIELGGGILAGENINLQAGDGWNDDIDVDGDLLAIGDITAQAGDDVELGSVYAGGALDVTSNTSGHGFFGGEVTIKGPVQADTIDIEAGSNIEIWGDAASRGDMVLTADADTDDWIFGDIKAFGDLTSTEGSIELDASDNTINLYGDVTAAADVWFKNNVKFKGLDDQYVDAGGMITADGSLKKLNMYWNGEDWAWSDASLYLHANGDISLADDVVAAMYCPRDCWSVGGGVSIISDTGSIYTPGKYVDDSPALAIDIVGRSDHFNDIGVDLPFGPGKAAIVIKSAQDLVLHDWADLTACGTYYQPEFIDDAWTLDDRPGVDFLTEPRVILDAMRDPGDPFDAAIYLGSDTGNVYLGAETTIVSRELVDVTEENPDIPREGIYIEFDWACVPRGALIVDAYDTVTLGTKFLDALANGRVGDRLEVCSRISEWLSDALGRLPFPQDLLLPEGYNYVMRGSGDTDEPAWVLEEEPSNLAAPLPQFEPLELEGCPALMQAAAGEIGVTADTIQISVGRALAANPNIQPCEACQGLVNSAAVLGDPAGTRLAAMSQVLNQFVTGPTPPGPAQMASIRMALAEHVNDGTFYAAARQWDDALAAYIGAAVELGLAQEDTITAVAKYVSADDAALSAYVALRLSELGG